MRDLKSEIQNKVLKGLAKLGTVNTNCTYNQMGVPTYLNGESTPVTLSSNPDVKIAIVDFNSSKTSSTDLFSDEVEIRSIDKVAIFSSLLLSFDPSVNDVIIDADATKWIVKGKTGDAADAHWSLHIRPTENE